MSGFNSKQYAWADLTVVVGGTDITGIRGVKYIEKGEKEAVYAKGRNPQTIQFGNVSYEGEIMVLQSELERLVLAGGGSILGLNVDVTVTYGNPPDAIRTDRIEGVSFTETARELKQGDKFMEVTIPFIALNVEHNV